MISRPAWITQGITGQPEFHVESLSEREGEKEKEDKREEGIETPVPQKNCQFMCFYGSGWSLRNCFSFSCGPGN